MELYRVIPTQGDPGTEPAVRMGPTALPSPLTHLSAQTVESPDSSLSALTQLSFSQGYAADLTSVFILPVSTTSLC